MQHEIESATPLLDDEGRLVAPGWARQPYWTYQRSRVRAPWFRIKEWDYYYVLSDSLRQGISITISDLGYAALLAVCWLDFKSKQYQQHDVLVPFSRSRLGLDEDSASSNVCYSNQTIDLDYRVHGRTRNLKVSVPSMRIADLTGLNAELEFMVGQHDESMNIVSGWAEKPTAFYYNRKLNCLKVNGHVVLGSENQSDKIQFGPENSYGGLDWGRGNWTYRNRWYWASANGRVDGRDFGMNLGYGFGDRSHASENGVYLDGRLHKIDDLVFPFNEADYLQTWETTSSDGRLHLRFSPLLDRYSASNLLILRSIQHQVFGEFSGSFRLDDGQFLNFENVLGFAEDVYNRF